VQIRIVKQVVFFEGRKQLGFVWGLYDHTGLRIARSNGEWVSDPRFAKSDAERFLTATGLKIPIFYSEEAGARIADLIED